MARYSSFLGRKVEVQYRASDTLLPASGIFVADSGRSIFLEQSFEQRGQHRHFRWEIPYQCLIRIALVKADEQPLLTTSGSAMADLDARPEFSSGAPEPTGGAAAGRFASGAAAGAGLVSSLLPLRKRHTA